MPAYWVEIAGLALNAREQEAVPLHGAVVLPRRAQEHQSPAGAATPNATHCCGLAAARQPR
jgi:hypothetical protein